MRSWFNWAFRRTANQQQNIEEDHSAPVSTKSSLNADQACTGADQGAEPRNTNPEALTPSEIEEGVVFAKNNVFLRVSDSTVSPKAKGSKRGEEHASNNSGYFYMRAHEISFHGNTYIVHWLANSELKRAASGEPTESTSTSNNNAVTVELNNLEMIRIFYDSEAAGTGEHSLSNGQMVLYSKDGVFHIFKFISGGLEKLTDLLRECKFLREVPQEMDQENHKQVMFVVYTPKLGLKELHPAEHEVQTQLNKETWDDLHDRHGHITALKLIQKVHNTSSINVKGNPHVNVLHTISLQYSLYYVPICFPTEEEILMYVHINTVPTYIENYTFINTRLYFSVVFRVSCVRKCGPFCLEYFHGNRPHKNVFSWWNH